MNRSNPPPPSFNFMNATIKTAPIQRTQTAPRGAVKFSKPATAQGHRICLYGEGGVGKTTLCSTLSGVTVFADLDESLGRLGLDCQTFPASNWQELRASLNSEGWEGVNNIVIDTATKAEEMAAEFTLATIAADNGKKVKNIEAYGFGKGYSLVFDTFLTLLADLDRHAREGRNVILVCHGCTTNVPNPSGEDWLRYEPRLQSPSSGKASIRLRVREWADHVLFLTNDVAVNEDGKAISGGSRTIYRSGTAFCMAKSRTGLDPIVVDETFNWNEIIK